MDKRNDKKKRILIKKGFFVLVAISLILNVSGKDYKIKSPDGKIAVTVVTDNGKIVYTAEYENRILITPSTISIDLHSGNNVHNNWTLSKTETKSVKSNIFPPVKEKRAIIPDIYNEMVFKFKNGVNLEFRAYDDGVAYRFTSNIPGDVTVAGETAMFHLSQDAVVWYAQSEKRSDVDIFHTSFEEPYIKSGLDTLHADVCAFTPLLASQADKPKILITESDIADYPGMFLTKNGKSGLKGLFAPYPLKTEIAGIDGEFKQRIVIERADYIAKTNGNRSFPWRIIAIAPTDADLLTNDLVYRLAKAPNFSDFEWIKPGKSTEEWITGLNLYHVDFRAGINTETYKYYIDFAAKFGFEYVMLDAGWSNVDDIFDIVPDIDLEEIANYANERDVGIILWTMALTIEKQMKEAMAMFKKLGIKIIMTDFIDRNDQLAMNFMHHFASECAKEKFMCMIHGAPAPYGFSRTYPNMLTREGVMGSEYNIWSTKVNPDHNLLLPFIRMAAGPMDYEPGLLQNSTKNQPDKGGFERVITQGTRIHQLAMFVVYESPLQLFSGNLSDAIREPELMTFLGKIPTVWDETRIIHAELGKIIIEARRSSDKWFIGAINNWEPAEYTVTLDFLPEGRFVMEEATDGINADRNPHDYKISKYEVDSKSVIKIKLAPGGGFVSRISIY